MYSEVKLLTIGLIITALFLTLVFKYRTVLGYFVWDNFHAVAISEILNPKDAKLEFAVGNYYFGGGAYDINKAEEYFKKAIEFDEKLPGVHYQLSRVYFLRSDFYKALLEINKEIELHPDIKRSYYVRGLVNGYSGRLSDAEADFKEFLKWKPDSWAAHNDLAWIYFKEGDYKKSRDTALAGLMYSDMNPWLLNSLGVSLLNLGDKKSAKETFLKALSVLETMSPESWGSAYPGNNPLIYESGFREMKKSIENNLKLLGAVDNIRAKNSL